jgi:transposase
MTEEKFEALIAKGMSTREIATITGWDHSTIVRDLQKARGANAPKTDADAPATGSDETKKHRAEIAGAAAAQGVTDEPTEKYRIIYADPPWSYGPRTRRASWRAGSSAGCWRRSTARRTKV